jgi:hypothetical protein
MFAQNRKKMLFLKAGEGLQLILEFREQLFPGLDRAVRCVGKLAEKLGRLRRAGLDELSDRHIAFPLMDAFCAARPCQVRAIFECIW